MDGADKHADDIRRLWAKVHSLSDAMQNQSVKLQLHDMKLSNLESSVEHIREASASSDQLDAATEIVQLKLDAVRNDVETMKNAMVWGVRLIVGAVIVAILALVIRGGGGPP